MPKNQPQDRPVDPTGFGDDPRRKKRPEEQEEMEQQEGGPSRPEGATGEEDVFEKEPEEQREEVI